MGKVVVYLDDKVERELRIRIAELGGKRGDLSRYVQEAVAKWLRSKPQ